MVLMFCPRPSKFTTKACYWIPDVQQTFRNRYSCSSVSKQQERRVEELILAAQPPPSYPRSISFVLPSCNQLTVYISHYIGVRMCVLKLPYDLPCRPHPRNDPSGKSLAPLRETIRQRDTPNVLTLCAPRLSINTQTRKAAYKRWCILRGYVGIREFSGEVVRYEHRGKLTHEMLKSAESALPIS